MKKKTGKVTTKSRVSKSDSKSSGVKHDRSGDEPGPRPTQNVRVAGGRTLTEYLTQKGLARSIGADTSGDFNASTLLSVEGGRKYRVGREIAKGGMGTVFQAKDLNCRRTVAMKVLSKDTQVQVEDLLRFIEEAQITSQLEHPNIVPIHELGLDADGNVFYAMKYVRGLTLTEVLDDIRRGKQELIEEYPLGRLLTIFQKTCDAVAFAHSRGIVHRDLKPDNVMIGDYGEVQVMDWGLAKVLRHKTVSTSGNVPVAKGFDMRISAQVPATTSEVDAGAKDSIDSIRTDKVGSDLRTMSGRVMGTPGFMAPEQARAGNVDVDTRSDIYSLGAILYSILTLRSSVSGSDIKEVLRKIINGEIVPPIAYNRVGGVDRREDTAPRLDIRPVNLLHCPGRQIPPLLSDIAMKAMATDPADRYQTVKEFQSEVEAYQDGVIWHLVVDENFADHDAVLSRWEVIGGQYEFREGELKLYGGEPQFLLLKRDLPGDVRIEFECSIESVYLNDVGCFAGAVRSENRKEIPSSGYEFKYGSYDNSMNVLMRSNQKIWSQPASPLSRGEKYRVLAERVGSRLRMVVNNEEIFKVVDRDPLSGPDRTAVGIVGWMADMRYSWIRIYSLGTPLRSDLLDVAERHLTKGHYATAMDLFQEIMESIAEPERIQRARRGYEVARSRNNMSASLPVWRAKLDRAWPGAPVQLRMDNDGLTVEITNCGIRDIEPLRGMSLTALYCAGNQIESLEPLHGMPLVTLNCGGNPITSLEPLRGMPLVTLLCECCKIKSLGPLRGRSLTMLNCGGNELEDGLEPLRGMNLTWLSCWGNSIPDLRPLEGMRLTALYCEGNRITSLEPLKGMPLTTLICSGNQVESLEPLRGLSLGSVHCAGNRIVDLEPVSGLPLKMFSCHCNRIKTLRPLKDLSLGVLTCGGNELTGIESFIKNPPESFLFDCDTITSDELGWIYTAWSRDVRFTVPAKHVAVLLALRKFDVAGLRNLAVEFGGHHYVFVPKFVRWGEAKACCEGVGGHLLTITSREENEFVASMFPHGSWVWLGLQTTERGQEWVTGEKFEFKAYIDILRERRLGTKVFFNGTWSYEVCQDARTGFVIEWDD